MSGGRMTVRIEDFVFLVYIYRRHLLLPLPDGRYAILLSAY